MLRANSNAVAFNDGDDNDDEQQSETSDRHHQVSEMLQSLSAEYSSSFENQQQGQDNVDDDNDDVEDGDDDDRRRRRRRHDNLQQQRGADNDEIGAIGDEDQVVDIDFKDPAERAWEKNPDAYGDLFQLVPSDVKTTRRIDPSFWKVSVTVPTRTTRSTSRKKSARHDVPSSSIAAGSRPGYSVPTATKKNDNGNDSDNDDQVHSPIQEKTVTIDITPQEGLEVFEQEVDACKLVYGEENVVSVANNDATSLMRTVKVQVLSPADMEEAQEKRHHKSKGLWISFVKPVRYPIAPLEPFVEPWHNIFTFHEVQTIYRAMVEVAENCPETPCLFNMVQTATSLASTLIAEGVNLIDDSKRDYIAESMKKAGFSVRLAHEKLSPAFFTGSVTKFLNLIPKGYDVMFVENVMRVDLAKRFEAMQRHLFKVHVAPRLAKSAANTNQNSALSLAEINENILKTNPSLAALCDARVVFHGTRMGSVDGIVSKGFIVPGSDKKAEIHVRTGARYGKGIYSTPDIELALHYAESGRKNEYSVKVLVCAVLQGKPNVILDGEEPWGGGLIDPDNKGFTSHLSADGSQIVVFNPAQILPCFVLHLMERRRRVESDVADLGRGNKTDEVRREMAKINEQFGLVNENECGGDPRLRELEEKRRQGGTSSTMKKKAGMAALAEAERKKILTALARKSLPFGFGPAGDNFVVEEIGEYSDDDEDFDEYVGVGHESAETCEEYQYARDYEPDPNSTKKK